MFNEDEIRSRLPGRFRDYLLPPQTDRVEDLQFMCAYYFCCVQEFHGAMMMRKEVIEAEERSPDETP